MSFSIRAEWNFSIGSDSFLAYFYLQKQFGHQVIIEWHDVIFARVEEDVGAARDERALIQQ